MAQAIIDCPECGAPENYPPAGPCATHAAQTYPRQTDEEIVLHYIKRRDACPPRDRLTPRMEARQIIDALDLPAARAITPSYVQPSVYTDGMAIHIPTMEE